MFGICAVSKVSYPTPLISSFLPAFPRKMNGICDPLRPRGLPLSPGCDCRVVQTGPVQLTAGAGWKVARLMAVGGVFNAGFVDLVDVIL